MTDLTEKWKDGKLKEGFYYVYLKHLRLFDIATSSTLFGILERGNENCLEVLAPVPSYEEREKLAEENKQLKELLNYIRDEIADMPVYAKQMGFGWISEAAYRIDNAIGEK